MMSETVYIEVPPSPVDIQEFKQIKVNASFTMRNQGQTEEHMQVIFPLTRLNTGGTEEALYRIDLSTFHVKINGKEVSFTTVTTPPEIKLTDKYHGFSPEVQWAAFDVTFPVKQDVEMEVEYEMLNKYGEYGEGFTGIAYILETGAGWYGNIGSADITLRFPYPITEEAVSGNPPGYILSGNEMRWKLKNFEPTRKDNLNISAIHADIWQKILDLRKRVAKNPNDAEAWAELGDQYLDRAIFIHWEGVIMGENPHFTELALEARQKLIALRPDSGEAHYKLAEILWLSNPSVQDSLRIGGVSTPSKPSLDDPAIQKALKELKMARSLDLGKEYSLFGLNEIFPGLDVSVSTIHTVTVTPSGTLAPLPTYTLTPTLTSTITPTVSSTPYPTVTPLPIYSSTSSPTPNYFLPIVFLGLFLAGGLMIYGGTLLFHRLRSK
jgi:tetratricopeptide (TPR) repeat protein